MTIPVISVDEETIGDLIDVMKWAEEYMATKEPVTPTPADRQGFEPFEYTERS